MLAGIYNINVEQGATYTLDLVWKDDLGVPVNLTGYQARMMIRKNYAGDPVLSLTSIAGDIELGGALGTIAITASATQTSSIDVSYSALIFNGSKYQQTMVYDIELEDADGKVTRVLQGSAIVYPEATR